MVADLDADRGLASVASYGERAAFVRADVARESDVVAMVAAR